MGGEAWFTLAVTAVALLLMVRGVFSPGAAMFGAAVVLLVTDVTDADEAFAGFANPAPFTVAALYVIARAAERTGAVAPAVAALLGSGGRYRRSAVRLLIPTAVSSAFLNNTPIVAMLTPVVTGWSERQLVSPSRYLMPLSFAAILGGFTTVIGSSTNVAVSGLLERSGEDAIGMFELTKLGLPIALVGLVLLLLLAPMLLPTRRAARRELREGARDFIVDMVVVPGGPLDQQEVESGGLRHLQGVYLVRIERGEDSIAPVSPTTVLRGGDELRFVGQAGRVVDLQTMPGLSSKEAEHIPDFEEGAGEFYEVVLGDASPLVGRTLRDVEFRGTYQGAVLAIHRSGQRIDAKLGDVRLRVGDTLLLLADASFRDRWYDRRDFLLVSHLGEATPRRTPRAWLVGAVVVGIVALAVTGTTSIVEAALLGAIVLVALRVLTPNEARNAVDIDVIITIAAAFGLAAAIQGSGLADELSSGLVSAFEPFGARGVLLGIIIATLVLTELITNNAAAVLMFPIAIAAAEAAGIEARGAAITVAIAASASFLTPIGYQTNTMVYGPGGYRFFDYARLGAPLTAAVIVTMVILVPELWPA